MSASPPRQTFSTHMPCPPLPAHAAGDERSTALPSRGVNNSLAKSPPRDFDRPTGENSVHKEPASWRSGGSAPAFRAAQCAQETFNALRAPVAHQELLAVGDTTAKTFQGMTRGNMAEQPVEDHAQPPSGEDIVDKEPASCRSDSSAQDDADAAVSHASPTCLAHASP